MNGLAGEPAGFKYRFKDKNIIDIFYVTIIYIIYIYIT